jgi:hypothetical protein
MLHTRLLSGIGAASQVVADIPSGLIFTPFHWINKLDKQMWHSFKLWLISAEVIPSFHFIGMEFQFSRLGDDDDDDMAHVYGLGGQDASVLEWTQCRELMSCPVMGTSFVSVELCIAQTWPHSQWILYTPDDLNPSYPWYPKETGIFPRREAKWIDAVFGQHRPAQGDWRSYQGTERLHTEPLRSNIVYTAVLAPIGSLCVPVASSSPLVSIPIFSMRGFKFYPEDRASRFLRNVGNDMLDT